MGSSKLNLLVAVMTLAFVTAAFAAEIDMRDPHRAVGRENDVRVDAQLLSDVVRAGAPIAVTYQIQNFTDSAVAVAEKMCSASYDAETRTITVSVGSEIPPDGSMPRMATIAPGEKKTFSTATTVSVPVRASRTRSGLPALVQIKVSVLRDVKPFRHLIEQQHDSRTPVTVALDDDEFERWLEGNDTIFLNSLPVRFEARSTPGFDASQRGRRGGLR